MDIFKLSGKIIVDTSEAKKKLRETEDDAEKTESKMSKAFEKIGQAFGKAFKGQKGDISDTKESLQTLTKKGRAAADNTGQAERQVQGPPRRDRQGIR